MDQCGIRIAVFQPLERVADIPLHRLHVNVRFALRNKSRLEGIASIGDAQPEIRIHQIIQTTEAATLDPQREP